MMSAAIASKAPTALQAMAMAQVVGLGRFHNRAPTTRAAAPMAASPTRGMSQAWGGSWGPPSPARAMNGIVMARPAAMTVSTIAILRDMDAPLNTRGWLLAICKYPVFRHHW
jgi:hypothetical protein